VVSQSYISVGGWACGLGAWLLVWVGCPGFAAAASGEPCKRRSLRTVIETRHARVLAGHHGARYGCLFSRDRLVRLDIPSNGERLYRFELAGKFVGFVARGSDGASDYEGPVAEDLHTGHVVRSAGSTTNPYDGNDTGHVSALRITSRAFLAWIACRSDRCAPGLQRQVLRVDGRGKKLLDKGPMIHRRSLRVYDDGHVVWFHGDERRTASLR
jgi:hypothetical protein